MSPWVATTRLSLIADHHAAAGAAEAARRLVPFQLGRGALGDEVCAASAGVAMPPAAAAIAAASSFRNSRRSSWFRSSRFSRCRGQPSSVPWNTSAAVNTSGSSEMVLSVDADAPTSAPRSPRRACLSDRGCRFAPESATIALRRRRAVPAEPGRGCWRFRRRRDPRRLARRPVRNPRRSIAVSVGDDLSRRLIGRRAGGPADRLVDPDRQPVLPTVATASAGIRTAVTIRNA